LPIDNRQQSRRDQLRIVQARLSGELVRCDPCEGIGRWLTPMHTLRPCPCCDGAGEVAQADATRVLALCLACRGRGALGGAEAAICPTCRGFGAVAVRNRIVAVDVGMEGTAA
jgi:DnaJ-class molecular chaperone